jgi:DNA polymerase
MVTYLDPSIDNYCFIDTETLSSVDLKASGIYPYSASPDFRVMIVTYAIGDGPVQIWYQEVAHEGGWLDWMHAPQDLWDFSERVDAGEAWFVAWNAAFDRLALSRGVKDGAWLRPEHFLDAMAQAVRSHLPPDLASAGRLANAEIQKRPDGKRLIQHFCIPPHASPADCIDQWQAFKLYALDDIPPMREVWKATLPLSRMEWEQYWASERVNDLGMPVDRDFAEAASLMAEENARRADADISRLTAGKIRTVNQNEALCAWVLDRLDHLSEAKAILLREVIEEQEEEGDGIKRLEKHSLERSRVEDLIAYLERRRDDGGLMEVEEQVLAVLNVRCYGASATPRKFTKLLPMLSDGDRLRGQYVFNGAAATGRFSSRGLQIHNLTRATVGDQSTELGLIDQICDGASYETIAERGPVGRTLSRLIRPVFCATPGQKMIWADYSAIEARVLPWLGEAFGAKPVLDIFRANDADKSLPDIYKLQAGSILGKDAKDVTKAERQSHGKVPVLSLGFGGGKGALFAMARNYGASFTEGEAGDIVRRWRDVNPWARRYWDDTWEAALWCMANPDVPRAVGDRLTYVYLKDYMRGTLVCILPDGRPLLYPVIRWESRERKDKLTGKVEVRDQLTYRRGYGRAALWYGTLVENAVQGVAGSLLRHVIWRLNRDWPQLIVGHVHDECIGLVDLPDVAAGLEALERAMLDLPAWADGLPISCEASESFYYTKTID